MNLTYFGRPDGQEKDHLIIVINGEHWLDEKIEEHQLKKLFRALERIGSRKPEPVFSTEP